MPQYGQSLPNTGQPITESQIQLLLFLYKFIILTIMHTLYSDSRDLTLKEFNVSLSNVWKFKV